MSTVKNIDSVPHTLADGRLLEPEQIRDDVEITELEQHLIVENKLLPIAPDFELDAIGTRTIADVLDWVGDDPDRRAAALAAEEARTDGPPRSTLIRNLSRDQEA